MSKIIVYYHHLAEADTAVTFLECEGYEVIKTDCRGDVLRLLQESGVHILIMELDYDKKAKTDFIRQVRKVSRTPIVAVSKQNTDLAVIEALNAGADDYLAYPYNPLELTARVKSQIRRYTQLANLCENIDRIYSVDDLVLDDIKRKVTVAGEEVRLTPIEYKILRLLVQDKGKVFTIDQIYEAIWNMRAIGAENTIAVHIRHIRSKIERNPKQPRYLKVVWGAGYKVG